MFLRDRRAVILSIVLPVVVMPILMFGSYWVQKRQAQEYEVASYKYAVSGPEAERARQLLAQASTVPPEGIRPESGKMPSFSEEPSTDGERGLADSKIDFYVQADPPPDSSSGKEGNKEDQTDSDPERPARSVLPDRDRVPVLTIHFRGDRDLSRRGAGEMRARLLQLRLQQRHLLLQARGLDFEPAKVGQIETRSLASEEHAAGVYVGRFITLFVLIFLMIGGSAVAIDSIAGEKERGTLETLLTTSLGRREIITAKMLFVLAVALGITGLQILNLLVYVGFRIIELPEGLSLHVSPGIALALLLLYLPVVFLVSAVLLLTSGISKSYKEAQLYFMPVFFVTLAPAVVAFFPTVRLRSAIVLLPIGNLALGIRELLVGQADWPMLVVAWLVTALAGVYVARRLTSTLSQERLVTASEKDMADLRGGPTLFPKHVFRWFGLIWVVMVLLAVNAPEMGLRAQILVNVVALFLGASVFLIWRYRLNVRETLSLRAPHPAVWPAVILGALASIVLAQGVFRITDYFLPVPRRLLEAYSQFMLPPDVPFWQLVLLICVAPGICEEVLFRGLLLHGLRGRFRPLALALVVGAVFGFFHTAIFRIPATGFLGVIFTAATLLTGSIYPAMLWHALVNATSLLSSYYKLEPDRISPAYYAIAAVVLAGCFVVLWIFRRREAGRDEKPGLKGHKGL